MASTRPPDRPDHDAGRRALEAVRLGAMLDANHRADPGGLRSIGTCRSCGYLIFEAHGRDWRHLPSVEERDQAGRWLAAHRIGS
jgi:hypothetical protein